MIIEAFAQFPKPFFKPYRLQVRYDIVQPAELDKVGRRYALRSGPKVSLLSFI